jgi:hypothetical protein
LAPWLAALRATGYRAHLAFLSLPDPDLAVARVAERVRQGGHDVPEHVVRRRFITGLKNFFGSSGEAAMTRSEMSEPAPPDRVEDVPRILRAMPQAVREALLVHKRLGNPVAVWRDGRVVWIPPEEIPVATDEPRAERDR